jgi:WD40 repeat protein
LEGHTDLVIALDWAADSRRLITSGEDGTARVWEVDDAGTREVVTLSTAESAGIYAAIAPDGSRVITGDNVISAVRVWDVTTNGDAEVANLPTARDFVAAAYLPDERVIASSGEAAATVWDVTTREPVMTLDPIPDSGSVSLLAVTDRGEHAALGRFFEDHITARDVATGAMLFEHRFGTGITAADWHPDGEHLAIGTYRGSVEFFDATGAAVDEFDVGADEVVVGLAYVSDGRRIAAGHIREGQPGGTVGFYDAATGDLAHEIAFDGPQVTSVSADVAGERVAVSLSDGSVVVVDVETGRELQRFSAGSGVSVQTAFSPDGAEIATGGGDGSVRLFDVATGDERLVLLGHSATIHSVSYNADGSRLVTASSDGTVRVWALDLDELIEIAGSEVTRDLTEEECNRYLHGPC